MKALIDGDVIVYQCGFASDQTIYTAPDGAEFSYKKEALDHCTLINGNKDAIEKRIEAEPVEHCLHSVKLFINSILTNTDATDHKIFLTGPAQWREDIFPDYKANRDKSHKPIWYNEIKQYLTDVWGAETVVALEADDAMASAQWSNYTTNNKDMMECETCICTIDKDLLMVPGFHYNWNANKGKGDMFWVEENTSTRLFFEQWLTGDTSDNIPGIKGVGPKTATKLLKDIPTDPQSLYEVVLELYKVRGEDPEQVNLRGDLLWMQRKLGEHWDDHYGLMRCTS